jgi:LPS O-antigen subunit length determinant protein (WzzB/FepE family)
MTSSSSPSPSGLDLRVVFETPLRQFAWWLVAVLLVTVAGYPGVVCVTPMAWLIALRIGNLVALRSLSDLSSQRLTEAALAGGLLGLLQGILFGAITPFMGPIQADEWTRTLILIIGMLIVGTLIGAGLAYTTAYLIEQKRKQRTIDFSNK